MAQRKKHRLLNTPLRKVLAIIAAIILVLLILNLTNTIHWFRSTKTPSSSVTNGPAQAQSSSSNNSATTNQSGTQNNQTDSKAVYSSPTSAGTNVKLVSPSGTFVSNHAPNLSGSPSPNQEQSVCNGTPDATCVITFSKNGTTVSLGTKTISAGGSAYWDWTLQSIGLSEGSWQITATSSLNGQSYSTNDSIPLNVKP